jgi:D-alanyl-D-alanine carboxypeptidase
MNLDVALTVISNASTMPIEEVYSEILTAYLGKQEVTISEEEVAQFVGVYTSKNDPEDQCVFIQDNNVLVKIIKNEFKAPLVYKGNNRFVLEQLYAESISFTFSDDGNQLIFEQGDYRGIYKKE